MSVSGSDSEAEPSSRASAYVAHVHTGPSLAAALRAHTSQPPIVDYTTQSLEEEDRFQSFVASVYSFPAGNESVPRVVPKRRDSGTDSMAVTHSRSATLDSLSSSKRTPSLRSGSTAETVSTVKTPSDADSFGQPSILVEVDGALGLPDDSTRLSCPYRFLNCHITCDDIAEWDTHCRSHFRGTLPRTARCDFHGCDWAMTASSGDEAWSHRLRHLNLHHPAQRVVVRRERADQAMIGWLWQARVLQGPAMTELRQHGQLGESTSAYLVTADPRRDRRRQVRIDADTNPVVCPVFTDDCVGAIIEQPKDAVMNLNRAFSD
ncbi:hypothetical protein BAUCODRAFT_488905 [Baudoinia panamericana UAMH 10762]|uniref:Uncharacterized protein n=1 Tax=Baudoinia panamericana (strain UAMH 10762) TaxID=717646 RepID=M2LQQ8_BAUPA|nr:uncharacterized protein BAUCODRAFT_488905 [Baudoinia panamericana UAMH 10762]EMC96767.1 hypothetical protein BAUCODRAFT_488905 [Baudoinia panamericana UAMH 10762]